MPDAHLVSRDRLVEEEGSDALSLDRDGTTMEGGMVLAIVFAFSASSLTTTPCVFLSTRSQVSRVSPRWHEETSRREDVLESTEEVPGYQTIRE